ncbi:hypothetical protein EVAR_83139_1 [Eumeta japonica]|uniref:Uncharacterized protein n=1 Tax=Eumeta variegata TaxID=151549 RepID=A0A4C1YDB1_EUMVA|nr:hypothetical protein EVAR_83139_1 [Eumeta japonica]
MITAAHGHLELQWSPVYCRLFRKEYALFLRNLLSKFFGNTYSNHSKILKFMVENIHEACGGKMPPINMMLMSRFVRVAAYRLVGRCRSEMLDVGWSRAKSDVGAAADSRDKCWPRSDPRRRKREAVVRLEGLALY